MCSCGVLVIYASVVLVVCFVFFKQKTAYEMRISDWSSDVCSSDLLPRIFAKSRKIAFIEWHTGLGGYGELSHIPMMEPGSDGYERMFSWLGDEARETWAKGMDFTNGVTPDYRGWFSAWLPNSAPHAGEIGRAHV